MASVVVVASRLQLPDGSSLRNVMSLPGRGVLFAVRVPERVKGWLGAGLVVLVVRVMAVGVRVPTVSKPQR